MLGNDRLGLGDSVRGTDDRLWHGRDLPGASTNVRSSGWTGLNERFAFGPQLTHSYRSVWSGPHTCANSGSHRALVGVDDLTSSGKPNALKFLHVGDGAFQVIDAQRLARDHGMQ